MSAGIYNRENDELVSPELHPADAVYFPPFFQTSPSTTPANVRNPHTGTVASEWRW